MLLFFDFSNHVVTFAGKNWATGKPTYALDSRGIYEKKMFVDGNQGSCGYMDKRYDVIVDLNATVDRPFVKVWDKNGEQACL